ncbi:chaperone protein dnaJ C76, chloroplastic [Typha angustifolia]|uniref:chaperone protein dnaJ C76, chloroplastic n=1 Tax=Typha angustifolia TaxID=59011 RepID=UPI003C2D6746
MPTLLLNTSSSPLLSICKPSNADSNRFRVSRIRTYPARYRCRASNNNNNNSSSWISEYDLYELLGVDSSSDKSQIKAAYRALQKRCHPDIAGPAGHDMAIILNQVYSLLSDPISRFAYDQEQAKLTEFRGYTGKPLYSTWCGSEYEERAVFVDEVKCVGCLKCALFASKTFAIESVHGRARVVAQWADPEDKIVEAIQTCPVDCISMVERSNLAALEFLMSKQPRGSVRMSAGNTMASRVSNIFADVQKFQSKYHEINQKASRKESEESEIQRESRNSAVQGIRSISNWWYWQPHKFGTAAAKTSLSLILTSRRRTSHHPSTQRLKEAAEKRKAESIGQISMKHRNSEDYWTPMLILPSGSSNSQMPISSSIPRPSVILQDSEEKDEAISDVRRRRRRGIDLKAPFVMALLSAAVVGLRGENAVGSALTEHVGGNLVLEVINSFELQVLLAGVTWFVIGMVVVSLFTLVEELGRKEEIRR